MTFPPRRPTGHLGGRAGYLRSSLFDEAPQFRTDLRAAVKRALQKIMTGGA